MQALPVIGSIVGRSLIQLLGWNASSSYADRWDHCRTAKATYPKISAAWPIPQSGAPFKHCKYTCPMSYGETFHTPECIWQCDETSGHMSMENFTLIPSEGFQLELSCLDGTNPETRRLPFNVIVGRINEHFNNSRHERRFESDMDIDLANAVLIISVEIQSCIRTTPEMQNPFEENWPPYVHDADANDEYDAWGSDEKYKLIMNRSSRTSARLSVHSETIFGAIQALSTIQSLIEGFNPDVYDIINRGDNPNDYELGWDHLHRHQSPIFGLPYTSFDIIDYPKYPMRGIIIDTARSFLDKNNMFRLIETLHASKINTLHWHSNDDQSYSFLWGTEKECYKKKKPIGATNINLDEYDYTCLEVPWDGAQVSIGNSIPSDERMSKDRWEELARHRFKGGVVEAEEKMKAKDEEDIWMNITDYVHHPLCHKSLAESTQNPAAGLQCQGLIAPNAYFDRTDIAEVLIYAWLHGVNVIFDLSSPSHARSWGVGNILECDILAGKSEADVWSDEYNLLCIQGYFGGDPWILHNYTNSCFGYEYQDPSICAEQICGTLNIQILEEYLNDEYHDLNKEEILERMQARRVYDIFEAFTRALNSKINLKPVASLLNQNFPDLGIDEGLLGDYLNETEDHPKYVHENGIIHLGLDVVKSACFDGATTSVSVSKTTKAVEAWVRLLVIRVAELGWRAMAWYDIVMLFPELIESFSLDWKIIPHIWGAVGEDYEKLRVLTSTYETYVWSSWNTLYLDCGLSNTGTAGFSSWCSPYKSYWDLIGTDPDAFTDLALSYHVAANRESNSADIRALGAISPLWGEQQTIFNMMDRINPRVAALSGALWSGRGTMKSRPPLTFENDLSTMFDHTSITSVDFEMEEEWMNWTLGLGHQCYPISYEKTAYCYLAEVYRQPFCRSFTKSYMDGL